MMHDFRDDGEVSGIKILSLSAFVDAFIISYRVLVTRLGHFVLFWPQFTKTIASHLYFSITESGDDLSEAEAVGAWKSA